MCPASVTWGAARACPVQVGCKTGSEDWAVQNSAFCKMPIIDTGSLAQKMWCVGEMALALGLLEANLAWPSPCLSFSCAPAASEDLGRVDPVGGPFRLCTWFK